MYVRIETGHPVEYPFDYRAAFPNTVFSVPLSPELAASFGFAEVKLAPQPTFDALTHKVVETTPALVCGQWVQQWSVEPLPAADAEANVRAQRNALLADTDWLAVRAYETGDAMPAEWAAYRKALRDLTAQPDFPNVVWPDRPE